mmetsp:Transcript_56433/g.183354  ORF Transcript_56433/g.183354 Transcript_56433/m.183354 type:complete len:133 (+) Transcript_56433:62-460(+)
MALAGVRVLELEGLGPGPLAACVLADFGADVVTICRASNGKVQSQDDPVSRGKRSIGVNLKTPEGLAAVRRLAAQADVFIEPFRPGVVERLGLGPEDRRTFSSSPSDRASSRGSAWGPRSSARRIRSSSMVG